MKTIIIGLGNPILGDDGVGWKVAEAVKQIIDVESADRFGQTQDGDILPSIVDVECVSLGGLNLMEQMLGYHRAILIDSMKTGRGPVGNIMVFPVESLANPMDGHSASAHDTSLTLALNTARIMGLPVPEFVEIVAIEANNVSDFSEELSPAVAKAVPLATQSVINLLSMEAP